MTKKLLALGLSLTMALSLAACGGNSGSSASGSSSNTDASTSQADASASTGDTSTATGGKLVMGTSADYPPFEFHILDENGEDQIVGIDVSVADRIASDMGAELEVVDMNFDNLLVLMAQGDCDMVLAAMESTPERLNAADCSDPYYTDLPPVIVTKAENADQYTSLDDFNGKSVGAQTGTTKAAIITEQMTGATPVLLTTVGDLINQLVYDKCDAVVLDGAVANKYVESNPDLAIVDSISLGDSMEPYRVWVAKGDPKGLLDDINASIAKMTEEDALVDFIDKANELSSQAMA
ncbi:MAG: transporter substrate-binding domain-containing protein [Oscillospiraceae bacterium]|nr:transporter substrate-binding domain-containing protein [Oscillospiraceae bacterium]